MDVVFRVAKTAAIVDEKARIEEFDMTLVPE